MNELQRWGGSLNRSIHWPQGGSISCWFVLSFFTSFIALFRSGLAVCQLAVLLVDQLSVELVNDRAGSDVYVNRKG